MLLVEWFMWRITRGYIIIFMLDSVQFDDLCLEILTPDNTTIRTGTKLTKLGISFHERQKEKTGLINP